MGAVADLKLFKLKKVTILIKIDTYPNQRIILIKFLGSRAAELQCIQKVSLERRILHKKVCLSVLMDPRPAIPGDRFYQFDE
ncbi:hypothetical protein FHU41_002711 [Psychromicrobium silvestre]|uniref:Uncharacterized protein n=1 Tax=Psychromicrobium silvestre TaxID=1645614 RepID=A0A7Y9LVQ5_9MICC|nr:hypothetical protein [Psychromicrobium silvestre]